MRRASRRRSTPCWLASTDGQAAGRVRPTRSVPLGAGTAAGPYCNLRARLSDSQRSAPPQYRVHMSRTFRHRLLAGVGAAVALAVLPLLALAQTQISARGWTHDQFGRLVLDRAAR